MLALNSKKYILNNGYGIYWQVKVWFIHNPTETLISQHKEKYKVCHRKVKSILGPHFLLEDIITSIST